MLTTSPKAVLRRPIFGPFFEDRSSVPAWQSAFNNCDTSTFQDRSTARPLGRSSVRPQNVLGTVLRTDDRIGPSESILSLVSLGMGSY